MTPSGDEIREGPELQHSDPSRYLLCRPASAFAGHALAVPRRFEEYACQTARQPGVNVGKKKLGPGRVRPVRQASFKLQISGADTISSRSISDHPHNAAILLFNSYFQSSFSIWNKFQSIQRFSLYPSPSKQNPLRHLNGEEKNKSLRSIPLLARA